MTSLSFSYEFSRIDVLIQSLNKMGWWIESCIIKGFFGSFVFLIQ